MKYEFVLLIRFSMFLKFWYNSIKIVSGVIHLYNTETLYIIDFICSSKNNFEFLNEYFKQYDFQKLLNHNMINFKSKNES